MKILVFIVLFCALAIATGVFVPPRHKHKKQVHLLGEKQCTYGPSFWCQNLTNAADCHATKHCIQTVWIHQELPPDTSSICDTCKEMVKEARDQLESNDTMELIKEVFEGSCDLLRIKLIVKECDKIADDYIPDLVETLASQMNPQVVCSVAGLCNNPRVHELLAEAGEDIQLKIPQEVPRDRCEDCNTVMDIVVKKFNGLTQIEFMNYLLELCGKLSSYSDACSNIVIRYFPDIYGFLRKKLNANDVCLLSGECYTNFHKHEVEITPMSKIGYVRQEDKDDLPCELCEQLVNHLRDVLIANTTETEFKQVLEGLCKQTRSFKEQCLNIVDEYYGVIYGYLVNSLNATATCDLIGICPKGQKIQHSIAPLLLDDTAQIAKRVQIESSYVSSERKPLEIKVIHPKNSMLVGSPEQMQLPIDLLTPHQSVYNEQLCMFCQYFLHYCQETISSPAVEADIKKVIDQACQKLPRSVNATCIEFIDTYEPALIAILAQEIDPSQVCPMIRVCPSEKAKDVDVFMNAKSSDKCPFCLAIVTEIEHIVKGKTTKEEIKEELEKVCDRLPGNLKKQCADFIDTYTDELVEMIIADFKPAEVCEYLKFCKDSTLPTSPIKQQEIVSYGGDIETNAIFDDTYNGKPIEHLGDEKCVLCEFVMKEIDDQLKDKKTDDEIKNIVHGICNIIPKSVRSQCDNFVDQYADAIIILLQEALEPSQICAMIKLCPKSDQLELVRNEVNKCSVCISAVDIISTIMENPKVNRNIQHIFEKTCRGMPSSKKQTGRKRKFPLVQCYSLQRHFGDKCTTENDSHFDQLKMLTRHVVRNLCPILTYSNQEIDNSKRANSALHYQDPIECFLCKAVVKEVTKEVKGDKTKEKVREALQKVCKHLHRFKKCSSFVNKYSDKLVDLIVEYATSEEVCSKLMFCDSELFYYDTEDTAVHEQMHNDDYNTDYQDPIECFLCKTVVKEAVKEVKGNKTKEKVREVLQKVCKHLHKVKKCSSFVNKYSDKLVDLIVQYATSEEVCSKLMVCEYELLDHDTETVSLNRELMLNSNLREEMDNSKTVNSALHYQDPIECFLCKAVVKEVAKEVKGDKTKEKVREALQKVCKHLHRFKKCSSFVNKYSDKLMDLIVEYATSQEVCSKLMFCDSELFDYDTEDTAVVHEQMYNNDYNTESNSNTVVNSPSDSQDPIECFLCKTVVKEVAKEVKGNKTKEKVREALQKVCKHLHRLKKCSSFVNKYSDKLVDLIVEYATSEEVCSKLMFCDSELFDYDTEDTAFVHEQMYNNDYNTESNSNTVVNSPSDSQDPIECFLCKTVVKEVAKEVKGNKTKEKVREALQKVCKHLHRLKKCSSFVNKYSDKLVDLIVEYATSEEVCSKLMLCGSGLFDYNTDILPDIPEQISYRHHRYENPVDCLLCKIVIKKVGKLVKGNKTKEHVRKVLLKVCTHLHKFKKCSKFVNKYSDKLVDLIVKYSTSTAVCSKLMFCEFEESIEDGMVSNEQLDHHTKDNELIIEAISCILCNKLIVNEQYTITGTNSRFDKEKIKSGLNSMCQLVLRNCDEVSI